MSEHGQTRAYVHISGHVQGIYYRAAACGTARDRGTDGWVKNLSDGRAEAVFGDLRDGVEAMIEWCHEGGPMTTAKDVDATFEEPGGGTGFRIEC